MLSKLIVFAACVSSSASAEDGCKRSYTKLPDGKIAYGVNDGGCFFCAYTAGSSIPLSGSALEDTCQELCDSDPLCIAFEVARVPSLPVSTNIFGTERKL